MFSILECRSNSNQTNYYSTIYHRILFDAVVPENKRYQQIADTSYLLKVLLPYFDEDNQCHLQLAEIAKVTDSTVFRVRALVNSLKIIGILKPVERRLELVPCKTVPNSNHLVSYYVNNVITHERNQFYMSFIKSDKL